MTPWSTHLPALAGVEVGCRGKVCAPLCEMGSSRVERGKVICPCSAPKLLTAALILDVSRVAKCF